MSHLHVAAAQSGHKSVTELLLEAGAKCCSVDTAKMTPLHYACMGGSEECAKLLLEWDTSVSVDAKDISGCTPLLYCLNNKSRSMEKVGGSRSVCVWRWRGREKERKGGGGGRGVMRTVV